MKKILIIVAMFGIMSSAFADTLWILKQSPATNGVHFVEYKNMKLRIGIVTSSLKDNEYTLDYGAIFYKVNGKVYKTSLFEIEYDN